MMLPERWQKVIDQNGQRITKQSYLVSWKNCLWFSKKNPQLLSCQPNIIIRYLYSSRVKEKMEHLLNGINIPRRKVTIWRWNGVRIRMGILIRLVECPIDEHFHIVWRRNGGEINFPRHASASKKWFTSLSSCVRVTSTTMSRIHLSGWKGSRGPPFTPEDNNYPRLIYTSRRAARERNEKICMHAYMYIHIHIYTLLSTK